LTAIRAVQIDNLCIRQAILEFNINYRALSRYCKKTSKYDYLGTSDNQPRVLD